MAGIDMQDCINEMELLLPKLMKSIQFTTLKDILGLTMDITLSQFYVCLAVFHNNGCTMSSLADEMSLSPGTITGLVDRLEKQDLVKREHDEIDRRAVTVWLAEKGRNFMNEFQKKKTEYYKTILERVGAENREKFIYLLRIMDQTIIEFLQEKKL